MAVSSETINDTHYQSVSCSAVGGRPTPRISWLVGGRPPSDFPFAVNEREAAHSNGTSTLSSVLRFPTRLQDEQSVTCVVKHETLPNPERSTASVETYGKPRASSATFASSQLGGREALHQKFAIKHHDSAAYNTLTFSCCSLSLCSAYTLTDHKSRSALRRIHVGLQYFTEFEQREQDKKQESCFKNNDIVQCRALVTDLE